MIGLKGSTHVAEEERVVVRRRRRWSAGERRGKLCSTETEE